MSLSDDDIRRVQSELGKRRQAKMSQAERSAFASAGGKASAAKLTAEQRRARSAKGAAIREAKRKAAEQ